MTAITLDRPLIDKAGTVWTTGEQRVVDDPTLRVDGRMVRDWAEHAGVCVRPLLRLVVDHETGETTKVPIPCKSTRERVCPPCAAKARKVRQQQCREGWHREDEPDSDDQADDAPADVDETPNDVELPVGGTDRRVRSTRRRDDVSDLPRVPQENRTIGRTFAGNHGQVYRPSMFVTLTLPSYGRITPGTGTPVDPDGYDYRRAALDAIHLPRLFARWVQNLRRCAGYKAQYFAAIEPQKRLAPHVHVAIRGAIPRQVLREVTKATYVQVWWPAFDQVVYDEVTTGSPVWGDGAYRDPQTGMPLPTWEEAMDDLDAQLDTDPGQPAAHTMRFGRQTDVKGILGTSDDADRTIRYLTKYLTKSLADTFTPEELDDPAVDHVGHPDEWDAKSARQRARTAARRAAYEAHVDRLHETVRWLPCSPGCANWLRFGIQPKDCLPGLQPGRCERRAHERDNLGYGGRRVQVSKQWSGKTLAEHRADRATVVRETLLAAGIEAPEVDRMGVEHTLDDGSPRFTWEDVPMPEADYASAILAAVQERNRWRAQYESAKQLTATTGPGATGPPGGAVDNPQGNSTRG
ncbi:replication initiator [Jannaschia sp. R86511]|uniref:replication initiator n=1 Tax=Jannaschia sp. R86511 TaxID=3093853 RepID=UPI0036D39B24